MSLLVLEGLDRVGKSTVAKYFESKGYTVVHQSAPPKDMTKDEYIQEQVDLIYSAATKDIVLDRSYFGEACIWPQVYDRHPLINDEDLDMLREIEDSVGVHRVLMHDPNVEAHWKRCEDNKEPLTKAQFMRAKSLYSKMAQKYGFELISLPQFIKQYPDAEQFSKPEEQEVAEALSEDVEKQVELSSPTNKVPTKTPEQLKLEKANAINSILEKRILKGKGDVFDELEKELRSFLNTKLGSLLGGSSSSSLTNEEIAFFKMMYKRALEKNK